MTRPSLFWADTDQLTQLADHVRSVASSLDSRPSTNARPKPTRKAAPTPSAPAKPTIDTTPKVPSGSFEERLALMMAWIHESYDFEFGFVVDKEGLALVHDSAPLELIAATAAMSESWDELRHRFALASHNRLALALTEGRTVHILNSPTRWGNLSLGLVVPSAMAEADLNVIHRFFRRTVE